MGSMAQMDKLVYRIKLLMGWLLSKIFVNKFKQVQETFTLPYWGKAKSANALMRVVERLLRFYLAHSDRGVSGGEKLETIHKKFWQTQIEDKWFDGTSKVFDESLEVLQRPIADLKHFLEGTEHRTLCEIGTGDGRFLDYLRSELGQFQRFIGLDLSEKRIALNRSLYDGLEFFAEDAQQWVPGQKLNKTLFVTNGGVFEYFRPESLKKFAEEVAGNGNSIALFYEPIVADHDLETELEAKLTTAGEYSFSHNYPAVFESVGMKIVIQHLSEDAGYRGLCLIASSKN